MRLRQDDGQTRPLPTGRLATRMQVDRLAAGPVRSPSTT